MGDAAGASFELAGCSSDDSNEGNDGEKGREAEVHLFYGRVIELDCLRGDGMPFSDCELFYDLTFIQRGGPLSHSVHHFPRKSARAKGLGVVPTGLLFRHSKATRRKRYHIFLEMSRLTNVVAGWACHRPLVPVPMKTQ